MCLSFTASTLWGHDFQLVGLPMLLRLERKNKEPNSYINGLSTRAPRAWTRLRIRIFRWQCLNWKPSRLAGQLQQRFSAVLEPRIEECETCQQPETLANIQGPTLPMTSGLSSGRCPRTVCNQDYAGLLTFLPVLCCHSLLTPGSGGTMTKKLHKVISDANASNDANWPDTLANKRAQAK